MVLTAPNYLLMQARGLLGKGVHMTERWSDKRALDVYRRVFPDGC